jgi:hypothetical protein
MAHRFSQIMPGEEHESCLMVLNSGFSPPHHKCCLCIVTAPHFLSPASGVMPITRVGVGDTEWIIRSKASICVEDARGSRGGQWQKRHFLQNSRGQALLRSTRALWSYGGPAQSLILQSSWHGCEICNFTNFINKSLLTKPNQVNSDQASSSSNGYQWSRKMVSTSAGRNQGSKLI